MLMMLLLLLAERIEVTVSAERELRNDGER